MNLQLTLIYIIISYIRLGYLNNSCLVSIFAYFLHTIVTLLQIENKVSYPQF